MAGSSSSILGGNGAEMNGASAPRASHSSRNPSTADDAQSASPSFLRIHGVHDTASSALGGGGTNEHKHLLSDSDAETKQMEDLAKGEITGLCTWRLIVVAVILVTYASVTATSHIFLQDLLLHDAEESYELFTHAVDDATVQQFAEFRRAMSTLALSIAGSATTTTVESSFPFVTVPMFEVPARQARDRARTKFVTWNPMVQQAETSTWSTYVQEHDDWYTQSQQVAQSYQVPLEDSPPLVYDTTSVVRDTIWQYQGDSMVDAPGVGPYAPIWQCNPPPSSPTFINFDMLSEAWMRDKMAALTAARDGVMTLVHDDATRLARLVADPTAAASSVDDDTDAMDSLSHPHSIHLQPVFASLNDRDSPMVGFIASLVSWDRYLVDLLPEEVHNVIAVLSNSCGQAYTYRVDGREAFFLGEGDQHDTTYDESRVDIPMATFAHNDTLEVEGHCVYQLSLFFSDDFTYEPSNLATLCTVALIVIFIIMSGTFFMYDRFVRHRSLKVGFAAARSNAIISSLFPTQVRERLFAEKANALHAAPKTKLKNMLTSGNFMDANIDDEDDDNDFMYKSKPIADLFPETSILFADIAGFTAWSSVREPAQVFILLETLFRSFDDIAKKRRVFKVETVGDCYVAVTGLPDPRKDHAVIMARFAFDCMMRMRWLSQKLEVTLGPDTGDLAMRMGIHSGPVTAGVLRGERSRFQLFGDTMNTAARMEHTGVRDKIQLSQETADLLITAGKANWISQRKDVVHAKGKGEMQTYWLDMSHCNDVSPPTDVVGQSVQSSSGQGQNGASDLDGKTTRLIEWNVDVLVRLLKQIVARRNASPLAQNELVVPNETRFTTKKEQRTLDEVKEIITLPKFKEVVYQEDPESVVLDSAVVEQLHAYVSKIASMYNQNSFHNFEHASHVAMSVVKLLSRIVAPHDFGNKASKGKNDASTLHDHTYGITSDPLTQFSCILSALIHDADHPGVPNAQLVKEQNSMAKQYNDKSVAEQNSVDLAWNLLMDNKFKKLRNTIYATDGELKRFRQLVVNSVMATDIVDKELKMLRNLRWDRAFSAAAQAMNTSESVNRKATIVIEHLIQASDVAHTMQHWHIYRKWNELFFIECYQAYMDGRSDQNPADGWYEGEIGFFDFYIVPLAQKLKDCGVFGVSSDEYLNYAIRNRQEWEARGREVVDEMVEMVQAKANRRTSASKKK